MMRCDSNLSLTRLLADELRVMPQLRINYNYLIVLNTFSSQDISKVI